jgi:hypothetical protein
MEQHAELVSWVLQIIRQYAQQIKFNPEAPAILARRYNLRPEDAKTWWDEVRWANNSLVPVLMLEEVMNTLKTVNLIPNKVAPETLCFRVCQLV